ncbi:site-specific integrase [Pseudomonas sp. C11]|uniref:site-specific integrase n=1 Tax=Pseudomonas sp. C11 TaxID=3075550 RepID=UPI002AFEC59F|nr:site-specific integrase [Pseudomonas sp. C11]
MQHLAHYLYRDSNDQLVFRLILPRLLQQRFPYVPREIRWPLDSMSVEDARELALDLAERIRQLRFRLGEIKTGEGLQHELAAIRASIRPLGPQTAPRKTAPPHSSQIACPVQDLTLTIGRQRYEQLRHMPTFMLREAQQFTLQVPLPDLLGAAYPLMLKTQVFELHTLDSAEAQQRAQFILQGMAELKELLEQHLQRGEWFPLYHASFQLEALRRYLLPEHGLHFRHNPRWLALRPVDLRERDHEFLRKLDNPAGASNAAHCLHPATGSPHLLDIDMPEPLHSNYPQLPARLTFDLHTHDLHEAVLKSGFALERFDWLSGLVLQGQQFGGGIPTLNELRIHVEAIRARLRPDSDLPIPPGQTPPTTPTPDHNDGWAIPNSHLDSAPANPLGALFAGGLVPQNEQSPDARMTIQQLMERYRRDQELTGQWSHQGTRFLNCARLEAACELLGPLRPIQSVTTEDFRNLRTVLMMYPRNRRQIRELNDTPIHFLIEQGRYEVVHPKTAKKYFDLARAMFRFAYENEWIARDIAGPVRLKEKARKRSARVRRAYTPQELEQLLNGPVYVCPKVPRWRMDDFKFWLPLLGLFTGSRLNELCQLTIEDIHQTPCGVWVISHNLNLPHKLLKNSSSARDIPLHSVLLEKGFLDFVAQRRAAAKSSKELLFPEMRADTRRAHSHIASRWFCGDPQRAGYLQQCGFPRLNGLSFHSLRHTFINQLRQTGVDQARIQALTGHSNDSTTAEYGDDYSIEIKQQTIEMLRFKVDLSQIDYAHYQRLQKHSHQPGRPGRRHEQPHRPRKSLGIDGSDNRPLVNWLKDPRPGLSLT